MRSKKFKNPAAFARMQMNKGHKASYEAKMKAMEKDNKRGDYGNAEGNIGNTHGDDFWSAARAIVEQVFMVLKPGGHAVWVCKDFVKGGVRIPFCDQWRMLCEAVGFETLHEHHAEMVRSGGKSRTLDGGDVTHSKSSKSFFRRVAERNAALNNYWATLSGALKTELVEKSHKSLWDVYNRLTESDKSEKDEKGNLTHEPPSNKLILKNAKERAFERSGESLSTWNRATAIDYETVFCMVKPE